MSRKTFAPETSKKINWVVKMYADWPQYRNAIPSNEFIYCDLDDLNTVTQGNLLFAMMQFITEVRKLDGSHFPGKTIYEIVVCVQMHPESFGFTWNVVDDPEFNELKYTLDNIMKQCVSEGVCVCVC